MFLRCPYYVISFKGIGLSSCIHFLTKAKTFSKEFKSPFDASDVIFLYCMCQFYYLKGVVVALRSHGSLKTRYELLAEILTL